MFSNSVGDLEVPFCFGLIMWIHILLVFVFMGTNSLPTWFFVQLRTKTQLINVENMEVTTFKLKKREKEKAQTNFLVHLH